LTTIERELHNTLAERTRLQHELGGDPVEIRGERDGLQRALAKITREQRALTRDERRAHDKVEERASAFDLGL
jgi:hypothetical protein